MDKEIIKEKLRIRSSRSLEDLKNVINFCYYADRILDFRQKCLENRESDALEIEIDGDSSIVSGVEFFGEKVQYTEIFSGKIDPDLRDLVNSITD